MVLANGEVIDCSAGENAEIFAAGRVAMGMLGVMTEISMKVRPAYKLIGKQFTHTIDDLFDQLDGLLAANRHFEFFWFPYSDIAVCRSLNETEANARAPRSAEKLHARGDRTGLVDYALAATNQALPYAPSLVRPSHRLMAALMAGGEHVRWSHEIFPSPRTVRYNEMEYAFPSEKGPEVLREIVKTIREKQIKTGFPIAYRTVGGGRHLAQPVLSPRKRNNLGLSVSPRRCGRVVRGVRSGVPPSRWPTALGQTAFAFGRGDVGSLSAIRGVSLAAPETRSRRQVPQRLPA